MGWKGKKWKRFRGSLLVIVLVGGYIGGPVGYYFLPWSVRRPVYRVLPQLDRSVRLRGFRTIEGWDGLGLWGRDCQTSLAHTAGGSHVYGGFPFEESGRVRVLENEGYVVGYDDAMKTPLWVAYRVFDVPSLHSGKRPSGFRIDARTTARVASGAYKGSGYDRGHMAPNHAIATRYGADGQRETFLMSNVIPQVPRINRYIWKDLEMRVSRRYGRYFSEVWVVTGPVFSEPIARLDSGIPIPSGYYKIIADETGGTLRVLAFLVESDCPPYTRIKTRLVSVDELEVRTGLDFFPELGRLEQADLESHPAGRLWPWLGAALHYSLRPEG